MAGTITHYKVGRDVYEKLNINLDKDVFILACQGHDLLYFIKPWELPKYGKAKGIAHKLQNTKFPLLVQKYQEEILLQNNDIKLKSFLYGYITHHITDSLFHPFIHYQCGVYMQTKETEKYQGRHQKMESVIDSLIVPNIHSVYKVIPKIKDISNLKDSTLKVFKSVYGTDVGKTLVSNMNDVRTFLKLYRCDRTGIKRVGYKIIDKLTGKYYEFLSYNYSKKDRLIDMNQKEKWYHPVDNKENISSIMDLYEESIKKSLKIIQEIDKNLNNKKVANIDLNISATHGYECDKNYELKYFKD